MSTYVYAVRDGSTYVYIGQSTQPLNRLGQHAKSDWWLPTYTFELLRWGLTKDDALRLERLLIQRYRPVNNITHNHPYRPHASRRETAASSETPVEPELLSLAGVAERLAVSPRYVRRLLTTGQIAYTDIGTASRPLIRIHRDEIERFITANTRTTRRTA